MGFNRHNLELLMCENHYREISGQYLSLGKQTVTQPLEVCKGLFEKYGQDTSALESFHANQSSDCTTRHADNNINDHDLIQSISSAKYRCLDISEYEGADILHDMNCPVPGDLCERFDFIFNGSCLDNVWDPATFLKNTSAMLKPGGRIIHNEAAGSHPGAYLMLSAQWFFSYYAVNNFTDCKVYVFAGREPGKTRFIWGGDIFHWKPYFTPNPNFDYFQSMQSIGGLFHVLVIAEKGEKSTIDKTPIQLQYMDENCVDWRKKYEEFCATDRPLLSLEHKKDDVVLPYLTDHYTYLGSYE